jgi:hypothetical protein
MTRVQAAAKRRQAQRLYLPVIARQDWVAVLDKQGQIRGFLRADGFRVLPPAQPHTPEIKHQNRLQPNSSMRKRLLNS